jgi:predicted aminopeptidase
LQQLPEQRRSSLAASLEQTRARQQQFVTLVQSTSAELAALYADAMPDEERRARKVALQQSMRQRYAVLKQQWNGYNGYDRWFDGPLNNAQLGTVTTYNQWVPALRRLLQQCAGDFYCFYREADTLAQLDTAARQQRLRELSPGL